MKRSTLLIIGGIIIILLLVAWVYILFFNNNTGEGDTYADLTFGDTTDTTYVPPAEIEDTTPVVDVTGTERLRQLTTTPVAGFQEVIVDETKSPRVYWVELGTGQIHSIDLTSGEEQRISATTVPMAKRAAITTDGKYMMLQSGFGATTDTAVYTISQSSTTIAKVETISGNIDSFTVSADNTFLFTEQTANTMVAKQYNPTTKKTTTLFTTPFREATIVWGETTKDTHYFYPKPSSQLEGFLYQVKAGVISRVPVDGYGLSAIGDGASVIYSKKVGEEYKTFIYHKDTDVSDAFPFTIFPEKCISVSQPEQGYICAEGVGTDKGDTLDNWYKGTVVRTEDLWQIDVINNNSKLLLDINKESGRGLDIINLLENQNEHHLYFQNKNDQTLWLFIASTDDNQ